MRIHRQRARSFIVDNNNTSVGTQFKVSSNQNVSHFTVSARDEKGRWITVALEPNEAYRIYRAMLNHAPELIKDTESPVSLSRQFDVL